MSLGRYLKKLRKQNGFTINQVVEQSGGLLDKTTVSRIERDERGISLRAAYAFSMIYNVNLKDMCEYVLEKKLSPEYVPFETSPDERALVENYRILTGPRKRALREIVHGLALTSPHRSSEQARIQLKKTIEELE